MTRWVVFITTLRFVWWRIVNLFAMIGEVQQEAVRIGRFIVFDQAGNNMIVINIRAVVIVVGFQLIVTQACGNMVDIIVELTPPSG